MLNLVVYKVRTAQETHSVSVIKASQLMLCREIIAVCSEIHTKHTNTLCGQNVELLNVKPGGTYSNHWAWSVKVRCRIVTCHDSEQLTQRRCSLACSYNFCGKRIIIRECR